MIDAMCIILYVVDSKATHKIYKYLITFMHPKEEAVFKDAYSDQLYQKGWRNIIYI